MFSDLKAKHRQSGRGCAALGLDLEFGCDLEFRDHLLHTFRSLVATGYYQTCWRL